MPANKCGTGQALWMRRSSMLRCYVTTAVGRVTVLRNPRTVIMCGRQWHTNENFVAFMIITLHRYRCTGETDSLMFL